MSTVTAPIPVRTSNLGAIRARGVPVPQYDRSALVPRILHVGVGGFHRAHMALYSDDVAACGSDWGIQGVGLLEGDRRMADVLEAQGHLYTLIERDSDGSQPRVVGSIVDYTLAAGDPRTLASHVADPNLAILSLTITEGGYALDGGNQTIEAIVGALDARRAGGARPLTILSCDNVPGNGDVARDATAKVAERRGAELARYLESCTFPNSMVDRITPQTQDADRAWLRDEVGVDDGWPVVCEPFRQWVIEDRFVAGRPPWEDAGVLFTDRVHDWELYKLRMLNASHSCMAYLMALAEIVYVDEAVAMPIVRRYLQQFLATEAIPTLREIPGHPPADYAATVLARFSNTGVRDQIARICLDGTAKFPSFLIPTVEMEIDLDGPISCAALALAGWARYLGTVPAGVRASDSRGERAAKLAERSIAEPLAFLELDEVFTPGLRASKRFRDAFAAAAADLASLGPLGAIENVLT
ncbi:MAG TPA: mannitol dehydrogenase family protein [Gaiellaceae bacterium]